MKGAGALQKLLHFWPAVGIVVSVAGAGGIYVAATGASGPAALFRSLQDRFFDSMLRRQPRRVLDGADDPVVLVGYDEVSSKEYGNQLPRAKIAELLHRVTDAGAKVIVLDFLLSENDASAAKVREALDSLEREIPRKPAGLAAKSQAIRDRYDADAILAEALARTPVIEAYAQTTLAHHDLWTRIPERERLDSKGCEQGGIQIDVLLDTPALFDAANVHGNAFITPDSDGIVRRYPLFSRIADSGALYPSLALMAATIYLDEVPAQVDCYGGSVNDFNLGGRDFSDVVDQEGLVRVNFGGTFAESFPNYIPLVDALAKKDGAWTVPDSRFAGKIVFVGYRTNEEDHYTTPFDALFSGFGFHATVARSLVNNEWLRRNATYQAVQAGIALLVGLLGVLAIVLFPRFVTLLFGATLPFVGYVVSIQLLQRGYLVNFVFPGLIGMFAMLATFASRFFLEQQRADQEQLRAEDEKKQREATQRELGRFLSPAIVDIALRNPDLLLPAKKEISILFSDIRGFTTTAEGMSPEALVALLDGYLTQMTQIVFDEKGTLDKYIGDAVMALFGAPVTFEDHPANACKAALEMMRSLEKMQVEWRKTGQPVLDIGIGVNTGIVSVGRMGSSGKSEYTCLGDEVNFASRLEGLNKAYGTHILVGENTRAKAGELFVFRNLGLVQVKGKKKATRIFELLSEREAKAPDPAWMSTWDRALLAFLARDWNVAEKLFCEVADTRGGDPAAQTYLEFIEVFRVTPPLKTWEGTMERHEK